MHPFIHIVIKTIHTLGDYCTLGSEDTAVIKTDKLFDFTAPKRKKHVACLVMISAVADVKSGNVGKTVPGCG